MNIYPTSFTQLNRSYLKLNIIPQRDPLYLALEIIKDLGFICGMVGFCASIIASVMTGSITTPLSLGCFAIGQVGLTSCIAAGSLCGLMLGFCQNSKKSPKVEFQTIGMLPMSIFFK